MASKETYHLGGYLPAAVQGNLYQLWDNGPGTYTEWDGAGNQTVSRQLTTAEAAELASIDAEQAQVTNRTTIQAQAVAALTANLNDLAQDQTIITQAATITVGSITNLATAATAIAKLAQAVSILAGNDQNGKKELTALIRLVLNQLNATT